MLFFIFVSIQSSLHPCKYEKCKQRTHQLEAAGRVFGTPVALETDFPRHITGNAERLASQSETEENRLTDTGGKKYTTVWQKPQGGGSEV